MSFQKSAKIEVLEGEYLDRRGFDETVKPMTCSFAPCPVSQSPILPEAPPIKEDKGWYKQNIDWRARCTRVDAAGGEVKMWLVCDDSQIFKQPDFPAACM